MSDTAKDKMMKKFEKLPPTWKDTVESYDDEELKKEIINCQATVNETEYDMDSDVKLQSLKEDVKVLSSGYKDVIKTENLKVKYCWHLRKSRGQKPDEQK